MCNLSLPLELVAIHAPWDLRSGLLSHRLWRRLLRPELAAMPKHPRVFGIGYKQAAIPTIYPQPHDIRWRSW